MPHANGAALLRARRHDRDHPEDDADRDYAREPREDRSEEEQGDRDPHGAKDHLLLVLPPSPEGSLARLVPSSEPALDPLDERVDHRGLHFGPELLPGLDCRLELILPNDLFAHVSIVSDSRSGPQALALLGLCGRGNARRFLGAVRGRVPGAEEHRPDYRSSCREDRAEQECRVVAAGQGDERIVT
jgi:hypothetical protein